MQQHEPGMQQLESGARQLHFPGSASASTSTARTTISPQQRGLDISPQEMSPLSPNVTTTRPVIQSSHAGTAFVEITAGQKGRQPSKLRYQAPQA